MLSISHAINGLLEVDVKGICDSLRRVALPKFVEFRQRGNSSERRITEDGGSLLVLYQIDESQCLIFDEIHLDAALETLRKDDNLSTSEREAGWIVLSSRVRVSLKIWRHPEGGYNFRDGRFIDTPELMAKYWVESGFNLFHPTNSDTELPIYAEDMTEERVIRALYIRLMGPGNKEEWLTCPKLLRRSLEFVDTVNNIRSSLMYDNGFERIHIKLMQLSIYLFPIWWSMHKINSCLSTHEKVNLYKYCYPFILF